MNSMDAFVCSRTDYYQAAKKVAWKIKSDP